MTARTEMRPHHAALPMFLAAALLAAPAAAAPDADDGARRISVIGEGSVRAAPDRAAVTAGVVTQAATAAAALAANGAAVKRLLAAIAATGIAADDVATADLSVQPLFEGRNAQRRVPAVIGYRVTNRVHVTLNDPAGLGGLLDLLVSEGANRLDGVRFSIAARAALADRARAAAMADAKRKAALLAAAAGARLGPVLVIEELGRGRPSPRFFGAMQAVERAGTVPVAPGSQEVRARIAVTYAIE
jgi:uncharacterized protein